MSCFIRWSATLALLCLLTIQAQGQESPTRETPPRRSAKPANAKAPEAYRSPTYSQTAPQPGSPTPLSLPASRVRLLVMDDGSLMFLSQQEWLKMIEKSDKLPDGVILIESNTFLLEPTGTKENPFEFAARGQATIRTNQFKGSAEQIGIYNNTISMSGKNQGVTINTVNPNGQDMTLKGEYIQLSLTADSIQVKRGTTIDAKGARQTATQPNPSNPAFSIKPTKE